jgi:hypothetical protein
MSLGIEPNPRGTEQHLVYVTNPRELVPEETSPSVRTFCATVGKDHKDAEHFLERWTDCAKRQRGRDVRGVIWQAGDSLPRVDVMFPGETTWSRSNPEEYFEQVPYLFTFGDSSNIIAKAEEMARQGRVVYMGDQDSSNYVSLRPFKEPRSVLLFAANDDSSINKTFLGSGKSVARVGGPERRRFQEYTKKLTKKEINNVVFQTSTESTTPSDLEVFVDIYKNMRQTPNRFFISGPCLRCVMSD